MRSSPAVVGLLIALLAASPLCGQDAGGPCAPSGGPWEPLPEAARPPGTGPAGPAQAVAAALAYPGLGQLAVGSETKAAIVGAAQAFLVGSLLLEDRWTRHALSLYRETGRESFYSEYSTHFDRRQTLVWWVVVVGLLSVADAYVDAHLVGFDDPRSPPFADEAGASFGLDEGLRLGVAVEF